MYVDSNQFYCPHCKTIYEVLDEYIDEYVNINDVMDQTARQCSECKKWFQLCVSFVEIHFNSTLAEIQAENQCPTG